MAKLTNKGYKTKTEGVDRSKFFDFKDSKNIEKIIEKDIYKAIELYEEYLEHYPEDYPSHERYFSSLIRVGYYDKAFKELEILEMMVHDGKLISFRNGYTKRNLLRNIVYGKMRLLIHTERYQEAYEYIITNIEAVNINGLENISALLFFLKNRLGYVRKTNEQQKSYLFKQIAEYDEKSFIEHARRHIDGYETEEEITALFHNNFPLEKVFEEVKKHYSLENRISKGIINDEYYFRYDDCGMHDKIPCDYFTVAAFANKPHYITMVPVPNINTYPYVDLNYLKESNYVKVRKISQIEKFNQRYGK